jgi:proteasome activator subunit 4
VDALCIILKMVKPKKETKTIQIFELINKETNGLINEINSIAVNQSKPGYRVDNNWHLYDPHFLSDLFETNGAKAEQDLQKWENTNFLDKSFWGYYCWPSELRINLNKRKTFQLNNEQNETTNNQLDYENAMSPIINKFKNDDAFVQKFIKLSTIEEAKGNEKFEKKRFHLFKALFRNFGSTNIIKNLFDHLKVLVSDRDRETHECNHKLAAELIAGLIRGSKYWHLNDLKKMWYTLKPILDLAIKNITTETLVIWIECFSTSFVSILLKII